LVIVGAVQKHAAVVTSFDTGVFCAFLMDEIEIRLNTESRVIEFRIKPLTNTLRSILRLEKIDCRECPASAEILLIGRGQHKRVWQTIPIGNGKYGGNWKWLLKLIIGLNGEHNGRQRENTTAHMETEDYNHPSSKSNKGIRPFCDGRLKKTVLDQHRRLTNGLKKRGFTKVSIGYYENVIGEPSVRHKKRDEYAQDQMSSLGLLVLDSDKRSHICGSAS
jgi:hypothetical protein